MLNKDDNDAYTTYNTHIKAEKFSIFTFFHIIAAFCRGGLLSH